MKLSESQKWFLLIGGLAAGVLIYLLRPILTPFLLSAFLAYLGDPLVDHLQRYGISRTLAVFTVFALITLLGLAVIVILFPLLQQQFLSLITQVPEALAWLEQWITEALPGVVDPKSLKEALSSHWQQVGMALTGIIQKVSQSSQVLLSWAAYMVLIPVVTFYLLRDWDPLVARTHDLIPPRYAPTVLKLAGECDEVLAAFFRGQLLVMLGLGCIYTLGLWAVGLDYALSVGLLAALVSFVPYLGFVVGMTVASLGALVQFHDAVHIVYVALVFGVGQVIEGSVLSPWLVGERIGLHPVAVIFAVMAGGQLFGFFGVLLALPLAAIIMVLLRHSHELYVGSKFYTP